MLAPASVFASPEQVLESAELTSAQKTEVLLRWEYDAEAAGDEATAGLLSDRLAYHEKHGVVLTAPDQQLE
jgi:hypothetical protein